MRMLDDGDRGHLGAVVDSIPTDSGHEVVGLEEGWYCGCDFGEQSSGYEQRICDIRSTADNLHGFDAAVAPAAISNDPVGHLSAKVPVTSPLERARDVAAACFVALDAPRGRQRTWVRRRSRRGRRADPGYRRAGVDSPRRLGRRCFGARSGQAGRPCGLRKDPDNLAPFVSAWTFARGIDEPPAADMGRIGFDLDDLRGASYLRMVQFRELIDAERPERGRLRIVDATS